MIPVSFAKNSKCLACIWLQFPHTNRGKDLSKLYRQNSNNLLYFTVIKNTRMQYVRYNTIHMKEKSPQGQILVFSTNCFFLGERGWNLKKCQVLHHDNFFPKTTSCKKGPFVCKQGLNKFKTHENVKKISYHLYVFVLSCRSFEETVVHDQEDLMNKAMLRTHNYFCT